MRTVPKLEIALKNSDRKDLGLSKTNDAKLTLKIPSWAQNIPSCQDVYFQKVALPFELQESHVLTGKTDVRWYTSMVPRHPSFIIRQPQDSSLEGSQVGDGKKQFASNLDPFGKPPAELSISGCLGEETQWLPYLTESIFSAMSTSSCSWTTTQACGVYGNHMTAIERTVGQFQFHVNLVTGKPQAQEISFNSNSKQSCFWVFPVVSSLSSALD